MKACTQCGKCCIDYSDGGLSVSAEELEHWALFRPDIAEFVREGEIWFDPHTGRRIKRCPWLVEETGGDGMASRYSCSIYFDRPNDCRYYPVSITDMVRDGCEMIEPKDLQDKKLAQSKLDILMQDSRPALE